MLVVGSKTTFCHSMPNINLKFHHLTVSPILSFVMPILKLCMVELNLPCPSLERISWSNVYMPSFPHSKHVCSLSPCQMRGLYIRSLIVFILLVEVRSMYYTYSLIISVPRLGPCVFYNTQLQYPHLNVKSVQLAARPDQGVSLKAELHTYRILVNIILVCCHPTLVCQQEESIQACIPAAKSGSLHFNPIPSKLEMWKQCLHFRRSVSRTRASEALPQ